MNPTQSLPHPRPSPNLFFPIVLVGLGIILLLSNMGLLAVDPLPLLWRFWPVLLIVFGLDILLRHSGVSGMVSSALAGIAALALLIGLLFLNQANPLVFNFPEWQVGSPLNTTQIAAPLADSKSAAVRLELGSGEGTLSALTDSANLVEGQIRSVNVVNQINRNGDRANIVIGTHDEFWNALLTARPPFAHLRLNPAVEYDLTTDFGSGSYNLDLTNLKLHTLDMQVGSGNILVTLPNAVLTPVRLEMGSGSVHVKLPSGVPVRIEARVDSGSLNVRNVPQVSQNDHNRVYETPGFSQNGTYLLLQIEEGSGSINIE